MPSNRVPGSFSLKTRAEKLLWGITAVCVIVLTLSAFKEAIWPFVTLIIVLVCILITDDNRTNDEGPSITDYMSVTAAIIAMTVGLIALDKTSRLWPVFAFGLVVGLAAYLLDWSNSSSANNK